jgi:hypothetical protein
VIIAIRHRTNRRLIALLWVYPATEETKEQYAMKIRVLLLAD